MPEREFLVAQALLPVLLGFTLHRPDPSLSSFASRFRSGRSGPQRNPNLQTKRQSPLTDYWLPIT